MGELDQYGLEATSPSEVPPGGADASADSPIDANVNPRIDASGDGPGDASTDGTLRAAPETLVLAVKADAHVNNSDPKKNYGAAKKLLVGTAPARNEAFVKFALPPLETEVLNATLRLFVADATDNGPKVFLTTGVWEESKVNWDNRPQKSGAAVSNVGAVNAGWLEIDVTSAISASGEVSFLLLPESEDRVDFESREGTNKPELVIVTEGVPCDGLVQPLGQLGEQCCNIGEAACAGNAQKVVLVCDPNHTWVALRTCSDDSLCDSRVGPHQGSCQPAVPDCIGRQPGDVFCRDRVLVKCGPDLVTSEETACTFACSGAKCAGVCVPGARDCQGETPRACSNDGKWVPEATCPFLCSGAGECTGECVPGAKTCDGHTPRTCDAQGHWVSEATCPEVCFAGQCELACPMGGKQCAGLVPQSCAETGLWEDGPTCQFVCIEGGCVGQCVPSSKQCVGLVPQACDALGEWQSGSACQYVCQAGSCTGVCTPGSKDCQGLVPRTCNANGQWQTAAACPFVCTEGSCTGVCSPGATGCSGLIPRTCDASGQWTNASACEYVCQAGACTGVCTPGSEDCQGLVPRTCNASGQWQAAAACQYVCSEGSCTGVCTPGTKRCSGQVPQTCSAAGQWQSGATCGGDTPLCVAGSCQVNPPKVNTVQPASVAIAATQVLTVGGWDFKQGAVVVFNGTELATTYNAANQLVATLPASLTQVSGQYPLYVANTLGNPATYGNAIPLTVNQVSGAPVVIDYHPDNGQPGATVLIVGTNLTGSPVTLQDDNGMTASGGAAGTIDWAGTNRQTIAFTIPAGWTTGPIRFANAKGVFTGRRFNVGKNLVTLSGTVVKVSSQYSSSYAATRGIDNNLRTSWFTANNNCATASACTSIPWFEATLPATKTIKGLSMRGNREDASGYDFIQGKFEVFGPAGELLWGVSYGIPEPQRDLDIDFNTPIAGARKVKFTASVDESVEPGFSELQVFGP